MSAQQLTFEQFKASGRDVEDLRAIQPDAFEVVTPGRVYAGELVIEGSNSAGPRGPWWSVTILASVKSSNDLESLERDLYDFGVRENLLVKPDYTLGEWEVFDNRGDPHFKANAAGLIGVASGPFAADIAHCYGFSSTRSIDETLANARLISAAPNLLKALRAFIKSEEDIALMSYGTHVGDGRVELTADDWRDTDPEGFTLVQQGKAAIAKVEGRS